MGTHFMHSRSRFTIGPRIPTMPGRGTSGFHPGARFRLRRLELKDGMTRGREAALLRAGLDSRG